MDSHRHFGCENDWRWDRKSDGNGMTNKHTNKIRGDNQNNDNNTLQGHVWDGENYIYNGKRGGRRGGKVNEDDKPRIVTVLVKDEKVTAIENEAFSCCELLRHVEICHTKLKRIADSSFRGCIRLENISFSRSSSTSSTCGSTLEVIGTSAFHGCSSIKSVNLPDSVHTIGPSAFNGCHMLETVRLPNTYHDTDDDHNSTNNDNFHTSKSNNNNNINNSSTCSVKALKIIPTCSFYQCKSLQTISLPSSIQRIDDFAFYGCQRLMNVNLFFSSEQKNNHHHQQQQHQHQKQDHQEELLPVLHTIGRNAFKGCTGLTTIEFPSTLRIIKSSAFSRCTELSTIQFAKKPSTVTIETSTNSSPALREIGGHAFEYCSNLLNVEIPSSIQSIGPHIFSHCILLKHVDLSQCTMLPTIPMGSFADCSNLLTIQLPMSSSSKKASLHTIGMNAFSRCTSLKEIRFATATTNDDEDNTTTNFSSLLLIGDGCFQECRSLSGRLIVPKSVQKIGNGAFAGCNNLNSIDISACLEMNEINSNVFARCSRLKSVHLPNTLEKIGSFAFTGCSSLNSIQLPNSIRQIRRYAFRDCLSFQSIGAVDNGTKTAAAGESSATTATTFLPESIEIVEDGTFSNCPQLSIISTTAATTASSLSPSKAKLSKTDIIHFECDLNRAGRRRFLKRDATNKIYLISLWPLILYRVMYDMDFPKSSICQQPNITSSAATSTNPSNDYTNMTQCDVIASYIISF